MSSCLCLLVISHSAPCAINNWDLGTNKIHTVEFCCLYCWSLCCWSPKQYFFCLKVHNYDKWEKKLLLSNKQQIFFCFKEFDIVTAWVANETKFFCWPQSFYTFHWNTFAFSNIKILCKYKTGLNYSTNIVWHIILPYYCFCHERCCVVAFCIHFCMVFVWKSCML